MVVAAVGASARDDDGVAAAIVDGGWCDDGSVDVTADVVDDDADDD